MQLYGPNVPSDAGSVNAAQSKPSSADSDATSASQAGSSATPRHSLFERMMREAREEQAGNGSSAVFTDQVMQSERAMSRDSKAFQRQDSIASGRENAAQQHANYRDALQESAASRQEAAAKQVEPQPSSSSKANNDNAATAQMPKPDMLAGSETTSKGSQQPTTGEGKTVSNDQIQRGPRFTVNQQLTSADTKSAAKPTATAPTVQPIASAQAAAVRSLSPATQPSGTTQAASAVKSADAVTASDNKRSFETTLRAAKAKPEAQQQASESKNSANADKLLRLLKMKINEDKSTAIMRLDPPEMGKIKVQIDFQQQSLSLRFDTTSDMAHQLLQRELDSLRQGLESAGINLERVEVFSPEDSAGMQDADDSQLADRQMDGHDDSADVGAEHSRQGNEAQSHATENVVREASLEDAEIPVLVAESLVNVMA